MTGRRMWTLAAFGVGGLAVFWHMAAAYGARGRMPGDEEPPAAGKVVRASAFVLEDAEGVERGRLALDGSEMVLEALGSGEEPDLQVRFLLDEHTAPRLTVSSPPDGSVAILAVGGTGAQPWFGLRRGIDGTTPHIFLGGWSGQPMMLLRDGDGPRIMLASLVHNPQLCLYDDDGELFWHTPTVPGWEEKYGAAREEEAREDVEKAKAEMMKAMEMEARARQERIDELRDAERE